MKNGVILRSQAERLYHGVTRRLSRKARQERDIDLSGMFSRWVQQRVGFSKSVERATPVAIYQMGKVGSTSIGRSLDSTYPGISVDTHQFSDVHPRWIVRRLHRGVNSENMPLNVISLTREPIGRSVSAFFENYQRDTGVSFRKSNLTVPELRELFLANFPHQIQLDWFENHIQRNFGIDVYASPFPEEGYARYANGTVRLLVLRSEIEDELKEETIADFLDLDSFQLRRTNVGSAKEYADQYEAFRREVRFPADYLDRMCSSRYFNHFYPQDVVETVRRRWSEDTSRTVSETRRSD